MADLGDQGKALFHRDLPAGAFVSPAAGNWLAGQPVPERYRDRYQQCVRAWRSAGLIEPPSGPDASPDPVMIGPDRTVLERAAAFAVSGPVVVISVSAECGFCSQLRADLAANAAVLWRRGIAVVLADTRGCGEDGWSGSVAGAWLDPAARAWLTGLGPALAGPGTPTALVLVPGACPRVVTGYDQVTAEFVLLSGAGREQVIAELPTSCSANVTAAPVDALLVARTGDGRLAGIAVRGLAAREAVAAALAAGGAEADGQAGYVPVTVTVERPQGLFLLFRGGELVARSRTADELAHVLYQVLAGFTQPGPGQVSLLCGAVVHQDGHAALFPRSWMSGLVKRATRLERAGWQIRPEPTAFLQPPSRAPRQGIVGQPLLTWPAPPGTEPPLAPVQDVWTEPLPGPPGRYDRGRLLAQVVNWIARPADAGAIRAAVALIGQLTVRTGTWEQAFLPQSARQSSTGGLSLPGKRLIAPLGQTRLAGSLDA